MKSGLNVLLSSVGRRSYMVEYFKIALQGRGALHAGNSVWTYAMSLADHAVTTPQIHDSEYIDTLLAYCREWRIGAVVPLFDVDLPVLAAARRQFEAAGVRVVVSDLEIAMTCNDKWRTHEWLTRHGIHAPKTYLQVEECHRAVERGEIAYPVLVKPRWGLGSIGIYLAEGPEELAVLHEKARADADSGYLSADSRRDPGRTVIVQERLRGQEYGLDILNDLNGSFVACVGKRKLAMRSGETDVAEIVADERLDALGRRLGNCLRHVGNLDVDCFATEEGFSVLELNCRFGGQYPFAHLAGADFPGALVAMLSGERVPGEMLAARAGTVGCKDLRPVVLTRA